MFNKSSSSRNDGVRDLLKCVHRTFAGLAELKYRVGVVKGLEQKFCLSYASSH